MRLDREWECFRFADSFQLYTFLNVTPYLQMAKLRQRGMIFEMRDNIGRSTAVQSFGSLKHIFLKRGGAKRDSVTHLVSFAFNWLCRPCIASFGQ